MANKDDVNLGKISTRNSNEIRAIECLNEFQHIVGRLQHGFQSGFRSQTGFRSTVRMMLPYFQDSVKGMVRLIISDQCQGVFLPPFRPLFTQEFRQQMAYNLM